MLRETLECDPFFLPPFKQSHAQSGPNTILVLFPISRSRAKTYPNVYILLCVELFIQDVFFSVHIDIKVNPRSRFSFNSEEIARHRIDEEETIFPVFRVGMSQSVAL